MMQCSSIVAYVVYRVDVRYFMFQVGVSMLQAEFDVSMIDWSRCFDVDVCYSMQVT